MCGPAVSLVFVSLRCTLDYVLSINETHFINTYIDDLLCRMNTSLMTNTCPNNNLTNITVNACRDDKSGAVGPAVSPHGIAATASAVTSGGMPKSLSFTPTSVLMKLSAEKENLDSALSKESKDFKAGKRSQTNTSYLDSFDDESS